MSLESGTKSPLGPLPQRKRSLAGIAVASLMLALGFANPALATAHAGPAPAG